MIYEEEIKEGYEARMDKKSLLRIIHKLALDKLVQHLQITLQANNREKVLRFICDPSVSHGMKVQCSFQHPIIAFLCLIR